MVHRDQPQMLLGRQAHQRQAQQRAAGEVEGRDGFLGDEPPADTAPDARRQGAEVDDR